jgi:hypothetical protein
MLSVTMINEYQKNQLDSPPPSSTLNSASGNDMLEALALASSLLPHNHESVTAILKQDFSRHKLAVAKKPKAKQCLHGKTLAFCVDCDGSQIVSDFFLLVFSSRCPFL